MGFKDIGIYLIGWSLLVLSILKLGTFNGVDRLQALGNIYPSYADYLLWIDNNFIYVWALAGLLIYIIYRPNNLLLKGLRKLMTFGKA